MGCLLIAGVFMLTSSVFGFSEIAGHFVIRAVLLIFLLEGKGFHKPPVEMHDRVSDRVIFVTLNFLFALASFLLLCYRFG